MRKFVHTSHTSWEIRRRTKEKYGIIFIKMTGEKLNWKSLFCKENIRLHYSRPNQKQWFLFVRLPFLYIDKDNFNVRIGTPNRYVWFIK